MLSSFFPHSNPATYESNLDENLDQLIEDWSFMCHDSQS